MVRPLDGLLVVSLEQAIAAPYCTRMLADNGARVIKIERPDGGDFARAYDTRARGLSSHFVWTNRSKESVTLDVKSEFGRRALETLVSKADILVQNLAPGALDRLGFGAEAMRARFPRLIHCSISGYGDGGPYSDRKAYDLLIQAEAGFLSITGSQHEMAKAGVSIADIAAGQAAYGAVLNAIIRRGRTGEGDVIDISMLEAMVEWMGFPLYYAMDGAPAPPRAGAGHATIYPYGPFDTADGVVLFGLQNDREWEQFATIVLERADLAGDPRCKGNAGRAANKPFLHAIIAPALKALTSEEALRRLEAAGIGNARVNTLSDVWGHPQLAARERWVEVASEKGGIPNIRPISGKGWQPRMEPVPALGEHTDAVLAEFGITPAR